LHAAPFVFNGQTFDRRLWYTTLCDEGLYAGFSCTRQGGWSELTDMVQLKAGQELCIADTDNHRIRKANISAKLMTTLAGNTIPFALGKPASVWVNADGDIYVADTEKYIVLKRLYWTGDLIDLAGSGTSGYFGDGGPATLAQIGRVYGITLDPDGNIYLADTENQRIRKVYGAFDYIDTFAGSGTRGYAGDGGAAVGAQLGLPNGVCADSDGNIYIADTDNHRIRKVDSLSGLITTVVGTGGSGYSGDAEPAPRAMLDHPRAVHGDSSGNFYIADRDNHRIRKVWYDAHHQDWMIRSVVGTGSQGYSGDGLPAAEAQINQPHGLGFDQAGNLYIADTGNHCIRKVDSSGIIHTVAGTGSGGYDGDGVPATTTRLKEPMGVFVDTNGDIYIADTENNRIRKVDSAGIIHTAAGTGSDGYNGDGMAATSAKLRKPEAVWVDADGNITIADTENHRIRKVDSGGIIHTVAGTGSGGYNGDGITATSAKLNKPSGVQVDGDGNITIADRDNKRVRKVDAGNLIHTVAGDGNSGYNGDGIPAVTATLDRPNGIYVDAGGNLYIAETDTNMRIRKVDAATQEITTVAGNGQEGYWGDAVPPTQAMLNAPRDIYVDAAGNLYLADTDNHRIRMVHAATGFITLVAGNGGNGYEGDGVAATTTKLHSPEGLWVDADGHVYIADTNNDRIRKVDADSGIITTVAGNGTVGYEGDGGPATAAKINAPKDVCVDHLGNIIIADTGNNVVREVLIDSGRIYTVIGDTAGGYRGDDMPAILTPLFGPADLSRDRAGNTYIADTENHRIRKVDGDTGIITTVAGNGTPDYAGDGWPATEAALNEPEDVFVDAAGNIFIADTENHRIRRVDHETGIIDTVAGTGSKGFAGDGGWATWAEIAEPEGVFVDDSGNIYIADTGNHCIRKVDAETANITTVAGIGGSAGDEGDGGAATNAKLRDPQDVWVDKSGNIYIADTENHRIRKVAKDSGIITTVAGNGSAAYAGDGGAAALASLNAPGGVSVDHYGSIFIADTENHRIRRVDWETGKISSVAGIGIADFGGDGGDPVNARINAPNGVWVNQFVAGGVFGRP
jgi:sugar lactone lactonase YvrE